jgi:peptidoglycan/LPS O-acetylase OafA/YrhL
VAADVAAVLLFAAAGRSSHAEGLSAAGLLETAWPFLAGLAAGWVAVRARRRRWPLGLGDAVVVWVAAVAGAMALRRATGDGTDPAFVLVAACVLGAALLGWRAVASPLRRWRRPTWGPRWSGRPGAGHGTSSRPR